MENPHLVKAVDAVKKAIESDEQGNIHEAFRYYMQAFQWFELVVKYEKNPSVVESVTKKMFEYVERAEGLKGAIDGGSGRGPIEGSTDGAGGGGGTAFASQRQFHHRWDDVAGLEAAKEALREAVILPIKFPSLFTDIKPWKGILLYGPPGTGKSFLAQAVAGEAKAAYLAVSSADIVGKWLGDCEKNVRELFESARRQKPAIIFIDEIDSLCSAREGSGVSTGGGGSSDAMARLKTELLIQMQGEPGILVLGATNLPWVLDDAFRRRFERRIHITLPTLDARLTMFKLNDTKRSLTDAQYRKMAELTEGYSGADIAIVVRDALMVPIRTVQSATHFKRSGDRWTPCSGGDEGAVEMSWKDVPDDSVVPPVVRFKDFRNALRTTRPSVSQESVKRHEEWTEEFGINGE